MSNQKASQIVYNQKHYTGRIESEEDGKVRLIISCPEAYWSEVFRDMGSVMRFVKRNHIKLERKQ